MIQKLFPCKKDSKDPAIMGWQIKATDDPEQIKKWEEKFLLCNWGLVCGPSGVVVLDVDNRHGGLEAWRALVELHGEPNTRKHSSPNGGFHYFFNIPTNTLFKKEIQRGLDIRSGNAFVVVPPSTLPTGRYKVEKEMEPQDLPEWLKSLMERQSQVLSDNLQSSNKKANLKLSSILPLIDQLRNHPLSYEDWLYCGMAIHFIDPSEEGLKAYINLTHGVSFKAGDHEIAFKKWQGFSVNKDSIVTDQTFLHICRQKGISTSFITIEDFDNVEDDVIFIKESDCYVCTHKDQIVDFFNTRGLRFFTKADDCNIIRLTPDGSFQVRTKKGCADLYAPFVYEYEKTLSSGKPKTVRVPAFDIWFNHAQRKIIDDIIFAPESESKDTKINLYTGLPLYQHNRGCMDDILKLIQFYLCSSQERQYNWLLDYLAHIIQRPFEKSSLVPVHLTAEGGGKGTLYDELMSKILGKYFLTVTKAKDLMNNFNGAQKHKFLIFIDEANWTYNREQEDIVKRLTGSNTIEIEEKFKERYSMCNPARYVVASNNMDAVNFSRSNRRFLALYGIEQTPAIKKDIADLCDKIVKNKESPEIFYNFLLNRDIKNFEPFRLPAWASEINHEATMVSLSDTAQFALFLYQEVVPCIEAGKGIPQKYVTDLYLGWANRFRRPKILSSIKFWKEMRDILGLKDRKTYIVDRICKVYFFITPEEFEKRMSHYFAIPAITECDKYLLDYDADW